VLIAVERLLIRVRQPRSRADELIALRQRLRAELASEAGDDERALALAVRDRKLAVAFDGVSSCRSCATGAPWPWPRSSYDGGDCCSGVTAELFDANELAALAHAGTRPHHLVPPPGTDAHAGCAFRGPRGCTLAVEHRPARCVHYVCDTLRRELHARGQLDGVEARLADLNRDMQRFVAAHQARVDRDVLAPLIDAIAAATSTSQRVAPQIPQPPA
jgi:hypothetical protein